MRIDLNRIRDIDRTLVLTILTLAAGIAVSVWLVTDVGKREKAVDTLRAEVEQNEFQVAALPKETATPLSPEELAEKIQLLVAFPGAEDELREHLAMLSVEHHLDVLKIENAATPIDPAGTGTEIPLLLSLSVMSYTDITIHFRAEYEDAARFMDSVERLPQRAIIRTAELRRNPPKVEGTLVLRVYQKGS